MRKTLALCLLAIVAVAGNLFAGAEARMAGKVTDAVTKKPVQGVVVTVVSTGARNFKQDFKGDKDGYRLLLVDGTLNYEFTWSAPGYQPYKINSKLKIGDTTTKDIELTPLSAVETPKAAAVAPPKPDPGVAAFNEGAALYNFAMTPAASVSGLYIAHPDARYFSVGKIGRDQVLDYQKRKGMSLAEMERWLAPILAYEPEGVTV